jgi:hypothetical protein
MAWALESLTTWQSCVVFLWQKAILCCILSSFLTIFSFPPSKRIINIRDVTSTSTNHRTACVILYFRVQGLVKLWLVYISINVWKCLSSSFTSSRSRLCPHRHKHGINSRSPRLHQIVVGRSFVVQMPGTGVRVQLCHLRFTCEIAEHETQRSAALPWCQIRLG